MLHFCLRTFAVYIFSWEIKNCLKPLLLWCQGCDSQEHRERWKGLFFPTHHTCVTLSPPTCYRWQHEPSRVFLPCALACSCPKVRPIFLVFALRHLGQVFFDLFPCWFHVKAYFVMLGTACAQSILAFFFQFLAFVENFLQRQMLLLSGNEIWTILLRQLLIIVCTLLSTVFVILNISAPYKSTHLMLEFRWWISLFLSLWQK